MSVKMNAVLMIMFLITSGIAAAAPVQKAGDGTGFSLLQDLVLLLSRAGQQSGTAGEWNDTILKLAKRLKAASEAKQVDPLFAVRYSRLLSAARQALLGDPEVLYWPMYRFSMIDFIEERTGRMPDWNKLLFTVNDHGGSGVGLAMIAEAVMSEVVSLHIHLETIEKRQGILETYLRNSQKVPQASR